MATGCEVKTARLATAMRREQQHNLSGMARILLNGDFTFCLSRDFNELDVSIRVAKLGNAYTGQPIGT